VLCAQQRNVQVVAHWTGVPAEQLTRPEAARLVEMPSHLAARVIEQPAAVEAVCRALRRARCGLRVPQRPVASLLFAGPTGVGKSCLAAELAEFMFGSKVRQAAPAASRSLTPR
jgi:ATP-dependent Clp protease ATP-binding subunit ClpC